MTSQDSRAAYVLRFMELPHQFPYNPRPRLILFVSGAGLLWIGVQRLSWGRMPTGFSLWFGVVPVTLALVLGLRRVLCNRVLLLDSDGIALPTGLLQTNTTRISYTSIQLVWRHHLPATIVLRVATEKRIFEIVSVLLPDNQSFVAVEEFLRLKAQENTPTKTSRSVS
jgi:hypothetical protein